MINKFEGFSRGEIRKKANDLLAHLAAAYLRNILDDNTDEIKMCLKNINDSGIDWSSDVVLSVRSQYQILMDSADEHLNRWKWHIRKNKKK